MKKLMLAGLCLSMASSIFAYDLWKSSFTQSADSNQSICPSYRSILHGVCISSPTAAASTVTILVSTNTAKSVTVVDGTKPGCIFLDTPVISTNTNSLAYTTSAAGSVNILYQCY